MKYIERLQSATSYAEARAITAKSIMLQFMDMIGDQEISDMILSDILAEMGSQITKEIVRQYIVELEAEGWVLSRDIGFRGLPLIVARLRYPIAEPADCAPVH